MECIQVKCPTCGSEANIDESREFGFCSYCGTKVIRGKTDVENSGRIAEDEIIEDDINITKADRFLEQGDFGRASIYYYKALDATPESATLYWKLLLCKLNVRNNKELLQKYTSPDSVDFIVLQDFSEYSNALRYADDEQVEEFLFINHQIEDGKEDSKIIEETKAFLRKNLAIYYAIVFLFVLIGMIVIVTVNAVLGFVIITAGLGTGVYISIKRGKQRSQSLSPRQRKQIFIEYTKSKQFQRLSPKRQERIIANFEKNQSKE